MEFGIPTKATCEAQIKREMGSMVGYYGEKPHCDCSDDSPSPKETPKPQMNLKIKPLAFSNDATPDQPV
jgi:hypothetical protein